MIELLQESHWLVSRLVFGGGILLAVISGIMSIRKIDVTPRLRQLAYAISGLVFLQAAFGFILYTDGRRALEPDIHMVYGIGVSCLLPFFIYVEQTAEKRPAVGAFMVGGFLLTGLSVRAILTGG